MFRPGPKHKEHRIIRQLQLGGKLLPIIERDKIDWHKLHNHNFNRRWRAYFRFVQVVQRYSVVKNKWEDVAFVVDVMPVEQKSLGNLSLRLFTGGESNV